MTSTRDVQMDKTGTRFVRESGYGDCVELSNATTRVVLEPNLGGRVFKYQLNGIESLFQDTAQDGVVWDGKTKIRHPSAGRFDIGPEYGGIERDELWLGRWTAEITGPRSARLTSATLAEGLQLVREFTLDDDSSYLRCAQIFRNHGSSSLRTFHWSRTFALGNGIALAPLPSAGRFPKGYALGGPGSVIDFHPWEEVNVCIRDGILEIIGPPSKAKFIFDAEPGWLAYVSRANLLFLKKFPVYRDRSYGELAANNASIWYSSDQNAPTWPGLEHVVEIEAIGPLEMIEPGGERVFTEDWWLQDFQFPEERRVDLEKIRAIVASTNA